MFVQKYSFYYISLIIARARYILNTSNYSRKKDSFCNNVNAVNALSFFKLIVKKKITW